MTDPQKEVWDRLWEKEISYEWDSLSQTIYEVLCRTIGKMDKQRILEAGSGTGKISLRLAKDNAEVTLVDYSNNALEQSKRAFRANNLSGHFVLADIRYMPLPSGTQDVTWNAGVLEHFSETEQLQILQEMKRVTRPGGTVLVLVPYAHCLPYRVGKAFAEEYGLWPYGQEIPTESLRDTFLAAGLKFVSEFDVGFLDSLCFLDFIPGTPTIKQYLRQWYSSLPETEKQKFPGYLLACIGKA
ncbi:class I SAM-dependent methyltransferase [Kyrpidia sp.]|uniref:class I SAM-dependent methyltransferase n=1 Tax=Kyrpidia sp. TaxID=2073077 RepID=UPI00258A3E4D|nr:class I SAM-dependent methyltransferase [Kyrpidia sp.]MCL6577584.1 class I SAM-dependent methyltransferase [Kyrpidia sp.]